MVRPILIAVALSATGCPQPLEDTAVPAQYPPAARAFCAAGGTVGDEVERATLCVAPLDVSTATVREQGITWRGGPIHILAP